MNSRELKDRAADAFAKGRFARAAQLYERYCVSEPRDGQARLRLGDSLVKAGEREGALRAYRAAAEVFARDGFLPRAIAASKLVLELDPTQRDIQQMLADLYARRRGTTGSIPAVSRPRPTAPAGTLIPPQPPRQEPSESGPATGSGSGSLAPLPASGGAPLDLSAGLPPELQIPPPQAGKGRPGAGEGAGATVEVEIDLELSDAADPADAPLERSAATAEADTRSGAHVPVPGPGHVPPGDPGPSPSPAERSRIFLPGTSAPASPSSHPPIPAGLKPRRDVQAGLQAFSRFSELEMDFDALVQLSPATVPLNLAAPAATTSAGPHPQPQPAAFPASSAPTNTIEPASPASGIGADDFFDFGGGQADEAPPPKEPRSRPRFTELELDDTSLLNTIAAVAEAVANEGSAGGEEETVFSVSEGLDPDETPAAGELPHIPLFSDLPSEAFIELFERCPLRRVRSGQRIIQQGSYGDAFFVICEGAVRIVREDGGQTRELATLESGAFFGEVALLSDAPRTASVDSASDDTQVLEISAPVLTELSHTYPTVARALKKFCRERLLRTLMSTSALFRAFGKSDRRKLLERFRARDVPRGHVLVREGQESDGLYVLLSGEVAVMRGEQLLATLKEGDLFGEMSLLEKTPASATVSATRRTSLLRLPRNDFDALILTHPQALMHLAELSDARRKQTDVLLGRTGEAGEATLMLV